MPSSKDFDVATVHGRFYPGTRKGCSRVIDFLYENYCLYSLDDALFVLDQLVDDSNLNQSVQIYLNPYQVCSGRMRAVPGTILMCTFITELAHISAEKRLPF